MSTENRYAMDITVETQYVEEHSEPMAGVFSFSYTITITNRGTVGTQLISRHWIIEDDTGERREVKYYSESDFPHWVKLKRIAAVL